MNVIYVIKNRQYYFVNKHETYRYPNRHEDCLSCTCNVANVTQDLIAVNLYFSNT